MTVAPELHQERFRPIEQDLDLSTTTFLSAKSHHCHRRSGYLSVPVPPLQSLFLQDRHFLEFPLVAMHYHGQFGQVAIAALMDVAPVAYGAVHGPVCFHGKAALR